MIDRLDTGLVQAEWLPTLLVAVLALAGSIPAFAGVVGAAPSQLRRVRGLISAVALGLTIWGATASVALVTSPQLGFDGLAMALALAVAVFGSLVAIMLFYPLEGEAGPLLAGGTLTLTVGAVLILFKAALWTIHSVDTIVAVIAWFGGTAIVAAGLMVARMRLGPGTVVAAASAFTIMLVVAKQGGLQAALVTGGAPASDEAGLWSSAEVLAMVLVVLAAVPLLGALGWVVSIRSVERRLAAAEAEVERQQTLAELLSDDAKVPMTALIGCLDFMASEPLPLVQRSRLDLARACAREVETLLAGTARLGGMTEDDPGSATGANEVADVCVLVVDDAEVHRTVASAMLRRLGVHISVARDGEEALAALRMKHHDLVLMDIEMPKLGGFAATAAIRVDPDLKDTPVVGLSSDVAADREDALEAGMDDIISKPLSIERLAEAVERWCSDRPPAPQPDPGRSEADPFASEATVFWRSAPV